VRKFEQDFDLNPCIPGPRMVLKKATGDFFNRLDRPDSDTSTMDL
jgi:hypothetical protein